MILAPGATIGILGSGQLGRMLAMAALKLGLRCHIYAPEADAPAYDAASERTVAAFEDEEALARFAEVVDVITYEFENVPISCVEFLAERKPVRPGARALALTQDRLVEKTFLSDLGIATAPFAAVDDSGALVRGGRRSRPSLHPEDKALRLRRQGRQEDDSRGLQRSRAAPDPRRRPDDSRRLRRLRARGVGDRRAQPGGRGRRLRSLRKRARAAHSRAHPCAGQGWPRRRGGGAGAGGANPRGARLCRRDRRRTLRRPRGEWRGAPDRQRARASAFTTPGIGRSRARRPRNSSSTFGAIAGWSCSARRAGAAGSKCTI